MINPNIAFMDARKKRHRVPITIIFNTPKVVNLQCCTPGCGNEINLGVSKGDRMVPSHIICSGCDKHNWEWSASDI